MIDIGIRHTLRYLLAAILLLHCISAHAGVIKGQMQTATGGALQNGTIPFTLTQPAILAGGLDAYSNWRGTWSSTATYNTNDAVNHLGSSCVSPINGNTDIIPGTDGGVDWQFLALAGMNGPASSFRWITTGSGSSQNATALGAFTAPAVSAQSVTATTATSQNVIAANVDAILDPSACADPRPAAWCPTGTFELGAAIQAAINSLPAGGGADITLDTNGDTSICSNVVIDRPIRLIGKYEAGRLIPCPTLTGPIFKVITDSNSKINEFGQGTGVHLDNLWIEDTGFRTHSVDGIQVLGQDQFNIDTVMVRALMGYGLELNCPTCSNTPVRESRFNGFRTWWTGDPSLSKCSLMIEDDPSTGDRSNDLYFTQGQALYSEYIGVCINTTKANGNQGPDHIHFDGFHVEGREILSPLNAVTATSAPYDSVWIGHAGHITWTKGEVSNAGQGRSAFNIVGTAANPVGRVAIEETVVGGNQTVVCTVNTSGTAVTVVSGCTFPTDGTWNSLTTNIASVPYSIASVSSTSALTLTTSAGTQSSQTMMVGSGGYGVSSAYVNSLRVNAVWVTNPLGNLNLLPANGGFYDIVTLNGSTPALHSVGGTGTTVAIQVVNNSASGQGWSFGSKNDGTGFISPGVTGAAFNFSLNGAGLYVNGVALPVVPATPTLGDCVKWVSLTPFSLGDAGAPCGSSTGSFSLTTSGTSGAATYSGGVLNIPVYTPSGGGMSKIAYGSSALNTASIGSYACNTTTIAASGVLATDTVTWSTSGSITGVTGYVPSSSGGLSIYPAYATFGAVNFPVCNWTASSITPGAVTVIWSVLR